MPPVERMRFYNSILPAMKHGEGIANMLAEKQGQTHSFWMDNPWCYAGNSEVFDCRALPEAFVEDTGIAAREEIEATAGVVRLPYGQCYFEFNDLSIMAMETQIGPGDDLDPDHTIVELAVIDWAHLVDDVSPSRYLASVGALMMAATGEISNGYNFYGGELEFVSALEHEWCLATSTEDSHDQIITGAATHYLIGALTLLTEKLVVQTMVRDEAPDLNAARQRRGRPPVSGDHHVLKVNVPSVRRIARRLGGTHDTPALHWRRGHYRVNHRGSEFEGRTWVKKCLVGDPSKGFVGKNYQIVNQTIGGESRGA